MLLRLSEGYALPTYGVWVYHQGGVYIRGYILTMGILGAYRRGVCVSVCVCVCVCVCMSVCVRVGGGGCYRDVANSL